MSALNWDHNDRHPQFSGHHAFLPEGYSKLLHKLAEQVNVKLNCPVSRVTWSPDEELVTIEDINWQKWTAKKVHFLCVYILGKVSILFLVLRFEDKEEDLIDRDCI